jgi:single-strand DNA-binding protein
MIGGNITRDLEPKTIGETVVLNFSIAVNRKVKDEKVVSFFDMTAFGKTAEGIAKWFNKGSTIFVECRPEQQSWEKDGQKRSAIKFIIDRWEFAGGPKDDGEQKPAPQGREKFTKSAAPDSPIEEQAFAEDSIPF